MVLEFSYWSTSHFQISFQIHLKKMFHKRIIILSITRRLSHFFKYVTLSAFRTTDNNLKKFPQSEFPLSNTGILVKQTLDSMLKFSFICPGFSKFPHPSDSAWHDTLICDKLNIIVEGGCALSACVCDVSFPCTEFLIVETSMHQLDTSKGKMSLE